MLYYGISIDIYCQEIYFMQLKLRTSLNSNTILYIKKRQLTLP